PAAHYPDASGEGPARSHGTACASDACWASAVGRAPRGCMDHGRPRFDDILRRGQRLGGWRMVTRAYSISHRAWLFDYMEIRKQKGHSASAPETVILRSWSSLMPTWLREFLPMTISTPSVNSCGGINRACAVCCGNSPAQTLLWQMTSRRKLFFGPTKTSAAFAVKHGFPHGFTESPTIAFAKMRAAARSWWAWMKSNGRQNRIRRLSIPV